MSLTGAHLDALVEAGASAEQIVALVKADIAERDRALEEKRAKDAERQRRHRESRDVTVTECDISDKGSPEVSPPAPPLPNPSKSAPLNPPIDRFKTEWNEMAGKHGLPRIDGIGGNRLKACRRRCQEHGIEAVSRAIAAVPKSPHWLGENGWLGNFDSLMRPDNFQRMIEGAYCPKGEMPQPEKTPAEAHAWYLQNAAWFEQHGRPADAERCREMAAAIVEENPEVARNVSSIVRNTAQARAA